MKNLILFCSLFAALPALADPNLFVENPAEYSEYYTREQAGKEMRRSNGCTAQTIGTITFMDCSAQIKTKLGNEYLPEEQDVQMLCHFEYQFYNESFYRILAQSCQIP